MAYLAKHRSGEKDAPPQLQTSAIDWQSLASGRVRPPSVYARLGYGRVLVLPAFRHTNLGDISDTVSVPSDFGDSLIDPSTGDFGALGSSDPFGSYGAESSQIVPSTPTYQSMMVASLAPNATPDTTLAAIAPGSQAAQALQAAATSGAPAGSPTYNTLLQSGLTAAQIAAVAAKTLAPSAVTVPTTALAAASIVPGVSNSTLFIGALIGLMILSSSKKR